MKKLLFILSVWLLTAVVSNAQPLLLNTIPNTFNFLSPGIAGTKSKIPEIDVDILERYTNGASVNLIFLKSNTIGLPVIFFQDMKKADEMDGQKPVSVIEGLVTESEQLFQKLVMGVAFFHFLIDEEVVKKDTYSIQPSSFRFNYSYELKKMHARQ